MKYGFSIPGRGPFAQPDALARIVKRGEALGYNAFSVGDHIIVPKHIASRYPYTVGGEFPWSDTGEALDQLALLSFPRRPDPDDSFGHRGHHSPPPQSPGGGQGAGHH